MKIERTEVFGFRASLRAMRNPMNSWDKSDSIFDLVDIAAGISSEGVQIGPDDLKLACKLIRGGSEHRKFLRQIMVWVDATLPRYVWTEMDTYKVATVRNSCSTMHKLGRRELTYDDFEGGVVLDAVLVELNRLGAAFRAKEVMSFVSNDATLIQLEGYDIIRYMKALLPESFLQKATMTFNYETLLSMHRQRRNHRLPQWRATCAGSLCEWIETLPYMAEFIVAANTGNV